MSDDSEKALSTPSASADSLQVPEGMKLVPTKPTPSMLEKCGPMTGYDPESETPDRDHCAWYTAMVEAAPTLPYAVSHGGHTQVEHIDPLLRHLTEWTRQVGEQPPSRVAHGIASCARKYHAQLQALPANASIVSSTPTSRASAGQKLEALHDRIGSMLDQVGTPDYSLRELVNGMRDVRDEFLRLRDEASVINGTTTADPLINGSSAPSANVPIPQVVVEAMQQLCYKPGEHRGFQHIDYCRWCHYSRAYPHGDDCPMKLLAPVENCAEPKS